MRRRVAPVPTTVSLAIPLALLLALLLAACGGSSAPAGDDGGSAEASPAASASADEMVALPSEEPSVDAGAGGATDTGGDMADPELAARIPTSVDGEAVTVSTTDFSKLPDGMDAAQMFAGGDTLSTWLKDNGKTWRDVSIGSAMTEEIIASSADQKTAFLTAIRVKGASPDGLLTWFGGSSNAQAFSETDKKTIGSRSVSFWGIQGLTSGGLYVWADGDTIYWLSNANPEAFAEAFIAAIK